MIILTLTHFHCLNCGNAGSGGQITLVHYDVRFACIRCGNDKPKLQKLHGVITDPQFKLPRFLRKELQ